MANELTYWDYLLDRLKRLQRRFYQPAYQDLELGAGWMRRPQDAAYHESIIPLTIPRPINSLLIFKPDEIGDAVCALPALAELKRELPDTRFYLICSAESRPIYERTGFFSGITTAQVKTKFRRFRRLAVHAALRDLGVEDFDVAIFLKTYPPLFREFLKVSARYRIHSRDPRMPSDSLYQTRVSLWGHDRAHQALQLLQLTTPLTGKHYTNKDVKFPKLQWTQSDREAVAITFPQGAPKRFLVAHPFSKFETRRYPMEYWKTLFSELHAKLGIPIVTIGGASDELLAGYPPLVQAQGKLTLGQTGYLLSQAAGFIGNLSGPAHLAGALGVPTVTLMSGHSAPAEWAPNGSLILRTDISCAPCHLWSCPKYGVACLKELTPDRVLPAILPFLS